MIKWTTPTIKIQFDDGALDNYKEIAVTFKKYVTKLTITDKDMIIEDNSITINLTQEQTSQLGNGTLVQANIYYNDDTRSATQIFMVNFDDNLLAEEMV